MTENVIWCEDCKFFGDADIGGEGWCDVYEKSTWYGCNAIDCPYFKSLMPNTEWQKECD